MKKEPINISIEGSVITYNNKCYNVPDFAKHIGISYSAVYRRMNKHGTRIEGLKELVFLVEGGYPNRSTVFKRDGVWTCSHEISQMSGCPLSVCYKRGERWQKGLWSSDKLRSPTIYGAGPKKGGKSKVGKWDMKTTPRKKIDELPSPGSWEKKNCPDKGEDYIVGVEVGNYGKSSSGGYYTR